MAVILNGLTHSIAGPVMRCPSMTTDSTTAVADVQLSDEVLAFCRRHDLLDHLGRAIELARHHFSIVGDPVVKLEQDPEVDEWYLVLEIRVEGDEDRMHPGPQGL